MPAWSIPRLLARMQRARPVVTLKPPFESVGGFDPTGETGAFARIVVPQTDLGMSTSIMESGLTGEERPTGQQSVRAMEALRRLQLRRAGVVPQNVIPGEF